MPRATKVLPAPTFNEPTFASSDTISIVAPPVALISPATVSWFDALPPNTSLLFAPLAVTDSPISIIFATNVALREPADVAKTEPSILILPFVDVITKP